MRVLGGLQLAALVVTVGSLAALARWFLLAVAAVATLLVAQQIAHFAQKAPSGDGIVFSASLSLSLYGFLAGCVVAEPLHSPKLEQVLLVSSTACSVAIGLGVSVAGHAMARRRQREGGVQVKALKLVTPAVHL